MIRKLFEPNCLGNCECVAFADDGCSFPSLVAVNDDKDLIRTDGWVPAQGAVGYDEADLSVAHSAAQDLRHIDSVFVPTVICADDAETLVVVAVAISITTLTILKVVAVTAHVERCDVDEAAFFKVEFALFVSAVSGPDAQMLFGANGRIAAHRLVVDGNAAIYTTAADEVIHDACDVIVLILGAVLGADDLPAFILCAGWHAEKIDACGDKKRRQGKNRIASGKLHSTFLRGGTLRRI